MEPGRCCSEHPDPASGRDAFRVGSLSSITLPYRGYICGSSVPLVWFLGASLALPSPFRWLIRTIKPSALHKQPFKMLTQKCIFECNRPQNLVTYVTLVPLMEGSERSHPIAMAAVPPWGTGSWLGFSVKTWICIAPAAYLYSCRDEQQMDVIIACALAHLVYTRSRLVSWSKMPIHRSPWRLCSLLQLNEGYILNRDIPRCFHLICRKKICKSKL